MSTLADAIRDLPDSHPCYLPGIGEATVGDVRRTEQNPTLDDEWEATLRMWARKATANLCLKSTCPGAGPQERRA